MTTHERDRAHNGADKPAEWYREELEESAEFRKTYRNRLSVVKPQDMPFENSPDGLIKHLVHEKLNTREMCVDAYMQFLEPGKSTGKHRHMWEEVIFVLEGSGYDLHWDVKFDCIDEYNWEWEEEPKHNEWKRGDFIYVPPYSTHQHFNSGDTEARLIVISNRIIKKMGFNWLDQVENAPGK